MIKIRPGFLCLFVLLGVFFSVPNSLMADEVAILPRTPSYWGRGGVGVALADDPATIFYNPAGLVEAGIGFTWQNGDLNGTNCLNDEVKVITLGPLAYGNWFHQTRNGLRQGTDAYAFALRSFDSIDWGASFKKICQVEGAALRDGWSADLGIRARLTPQIILGLSGYNLIKQGPVGSLGGRVGLAYQDDDNNYALGWDGQFQQDGKKFTNCLGLEWRMAEGLLFRAGWSEGTVTFGGGIRLPFINLDYAYDRGDEGGSHLLAVGLEFWAGRPRLRDGLFLRPAQAAVIKFEGTVEGGESEISLLGGYKQGADPLLFQIERAGETASIDGVILYIRPFSSGFGQEALVQEWRAQLAKLKAKGKVIVAYLEGAVGADEYYLAAAADKIVIPELAWVGGFDKKLFLLKFNKLSKNLGLNWQIASRGKYKMSLSQFTPPLNEEEKKVVTDLLEQQEDIMLRDIAGDRQIELAKLKQLVSQGLITALEGRDGGLIDEIGYLDRAEEVFQGLVGRGGELKKYDQLPPVEDELAYLWPFGDKVALINVQGEITRGRSANNFIFGGRSTGAEDLKQQLELAAEDKRVKAIILRLNSPGGDQLVADEIYRALQRVRHDEGKVIVASVGDLAASAGYYLAAACDKIIADPSSLVGSIGNFSLIPDLSGLYEKLGIEVEEIGQGEVFFPTSRPLSAKEKELLEAYIEAGYQTFIQAVARGRGMAEGKVKLLADGRIYTGSRAMQIGLIDGLGNFYDALAEAKKLARISGRPQVIRYESIQGRYFPL